MPFTRPASLLLLLAWASSAHGQGLTKAAEPALFRLPLFPVRVIQEDIPLSKALEQVGIHVRHGYVLFGIELRLKDGKEPTVSLDLPPDSTFGDAFRQVLRQVPNYTYEISGEHLINIYPAGAKRDPENPLNIRVKRFEALNEQPSSLLTVPQVFITELAQRLAPPRKVGPPQPSGYGGVIMRGSGPAVTVRLRNVTVRQILNAVAEATEQFPPEYSPVGWVYSFQSDPASPSGDVHSWMWLLSAPHGWKEEAEKGKNPSH